ncbi:MAG: hypothetical protein FWC23_01945 [Chitinispirillia bacterium]|nr:hypothetical protein [Chitinispirillia bacterium]MCL2267940.1 hypothetical protein [Chitinispirillia bacterium]
MKKILRLIIAAAALIIAGCDDFTTSYERIDDSEFRLLDFMYLPADASPGDTVTLMAVFAGKKVDLNSYIDWWISFNVITDLFGNTTVVDSVPLLQVAQRIDTSFSPNTQTVAFRIPIPEDIVRNSASIPDRWTDIFPPSALSFIPEQVRSLSKSEIIDRIEGGHIRYWDQRMLQLFTVPIRITAKMHEPGRMPHTIRSSHSIRYNNRLVSMGFDHIPINNNPSGIEFITVYKVRGKNLTSLNWGDDNLEVENFPLYVRPENLLYWGLDSLDRVIEVEDGYSYFVLTHINHSDDYLGTMDGYRVFEQYIFNLQYAHNPQETAGIHHSRFMSIGSSSVMRVLTSTWEVPLTPPSDRRITDFTMWLTVREEVMNERLRPEGSLLMEVTGRFVYK